MTYLSLYSGQPAYPTFSLEDRLSAGFSKYQIKPAYNRLPSNRLHIATPLAPRTRLVSGFLDTGLSVK